MKSGSALSLKILFSLGFLLVVLPLVLAVVNAAFTLRETARASEQAIYRVVDEARTAQSVQQMVADIERKAKLFVVLADPSLSQPYERQSYENERAQLREALGALLGTRGDARLALLVNELAEKERLIHERIIDSRAEAEPRLPVEQAFQGLHNAAAALGQEITNRVGREVDDLYRQAASVQRRLLIRGAALVLVLLAFAAGLFAILKRSIRQLDASIHGLGTGDFEQPIRVEGPRDLRALGDRLEWLRRRLLALEDSKVQGVDDGAGGFRPSCLPDLSESGGSAESLSESGGGET